MKKGKSGQNGMSKELAQMAAKQSAIRKAVEQLQKQVSESKGGNGDNLKKLGELMEKNGNRPSKISELRTKLC